MKKAAVHDQSKGFSGVGAAVSHLDNFADTHQPQLVKLLTAVLFLLGSGVIAGWVLRIPVMVQVLPGLTSMVFNTALCFVLASVALMQDSRRRPWSKTLMVLLGATILTLALLNLAQIKWGVSLGINWPELHRWQKDGNPLPGQMSTATSVCFVLAGANLIVLAVERIKDFPYMGRLATLLNVALFIMGSIALAGYFLKLELLYSWYAFSRMALHTSLGMIILSFALGQAQAMRHSGKTERDSVERITLSGTRSLVVVAVMAAVTGIAAIKEQGDLALLQGLNEAHSARADLIDTTLQMRSERAGIITTRPYIIRQLRQLARNPQDTALRDSIIHNLSTFLPYGFNYIGLKTIGGMPLLEVGTRMAAPTLEFSIRAPERGIEDSVLGWSNGFVLRNRGAINDRDGVIAWIETEQALPYIAETLRSAAEVGVSAEMELCGTLQGRLHCLSSSSDAQIYAPMPMPQAGELAVEAAQAGRSGVGIFRNRAGILTMAAYRPVGTTGLVSSLSMKSSVFYQPIRQNLFRGMVLISLIILSGALLLRLSVRRLARELEWSERTHRTVLNALQEGVMLIGANSQILACNPAAEAIIGKSVEEMRGLSSLDPSWRTLREDGSPFPVAELPMIRTLQKGIAERNVIVGMDTAQGERRWFSVSTGLIELQDPDPGRGIVASFVEITAQRETQEALAQSNRLREAILEASPYSIIATDPSGLITNFNAAAEHMLWYRREELIGHSTLALLHDETEIAQRATELSKKHGRRIEPGFEVFVLEARLGIVEEHEWTYVRKDGSRFPVQLAVTALRDGTGTVTGFLGIAYDITERKRREEYTTHIAQHDHLTGLPNRSLLYDRMSHALQRAQREGNKIAVFMIDLDYFKRVNDSLGHHVGDQLLQTVSERILSCVRSGDTVARMGGDEFVVLLPDLTSTASAENIARKIIDAVATPVVVGTHELTVTPSIGISFYPEDGDDAHLLLKNADAAMYWAKSSGRYGYQRFNREIERAASHKMLMETQLRRALRDSELMIYYQPQISIGSGEIVGFEALLRWNDPVHGVVLPDQFIAVAEETGLIVPIGEWVLRTACRDLRELQRKTGRPLVMSVNLSARQFCDGHLPVLVKRILSETGIEPACLELEITESMLMDNQDEASERLLALRNLGVSVAVDDFGTGFSSLSYLTQFPISTLKIDRSFISKMAASRSDTAVVQAIVAIADSMTLKVIAEGVETSTQLHFLRDRILERAEKLQPVGQRDAHAFQIQGYLIAEALPLKLIQMDFLQIQERTQQLVQSPASA